MTQAERDRLLTLKKANRHLITQAVAAETLAISTRQVRRLLERMRQVGDKVVIHGLKGQVSNRQIEEAIRSNAIGILSRDVYEGFGPTLAMEYLRDEHGIEVSKETVRKWMKEARLWRAKPARTEKIHLWRPRRSRFGELVQWDTSEHDWLEGRGEKLYLIAMIDDATSRLMARFVRHDTTEENMRMLWRYLEAHGRPLAFYTDKASLFRTAEKRRRDEPGVDKDPVEMPPTQIRRALQELAIAWIPAHSPQAKGRVERNFGTAQDRLVKGMRVAKVESLEQANAYLERVYLPWWHSTRVVEPECGDDAHRGLDKTVNLAAVLSEVITRQVGNGYVIQIDGHFYQIAPKDIRPGLRKADVRVEKRLDGSVAVRYQDQYLRVTRCEKPAAAGDRAAERQKPQRSTRTGKPGSEWKKNFDLKKGPKVWQAAQARG